MDLVINHRQVKKERKSGLENICEVILYETQDEIHFQSEFSFDYRRFGKRKKLLISHGFHLKLKNGDFNCYYQLLNESADLEPIKNKSKRGKNKFDIFLDLTDQGFLKGEKRTGYWGVRYKRMNNAWRNWSSDFKSARPLLQEEFANSASNNVKTILPISLLTNLRLNDRVIIRDKRYKIPDLIILHPSDKYAGLFMEIKKDLSQIVTKSGDLRKDKHTQEQNRTLEKLQQLGYAAIFAAGFDHAKKAIDLYFKNIRPSYKQ